MKNQIKKILRESFMSESKIKMSIPIPKDIINIKDVFVKNGYKLFVVGGAVRDALLGKTPKDYDLATNAVPDKVESMMQKAGYKTLETGKAFGVINVFTDNDEYEIATFRKDIGSGRRPDGVDFTTIDQDVKRRDLTINALFYDIDTGEVVDLVGGVDDLKNGIVRTVGSAEERFGEDRLRILRAIRFAGRFGSGLDPTVDAALKKDNSLEGISSERIRDEFLKGIKTAKNTKDFLNLISKYKLWSGVFPGLNISDKFIEEKDPILVVSELLIGNDLVNLSKQLNKLTYSSNENKAITFLVAFTNFDDINGVYKMKKLFDKSGVTTEQLRVFNSINNILPTNVVDKFINFKLSVTGKDVQDELGIKPGPEMGQAIEKMEINNFKKLL
jgi:tRNA nucleotidyltransferase/poly(A) polymerase